MDNKAQSRPHNSMSRMGRARAMTRGGAGCSVARLVALLQDHMPLSLQQATFESLHPNMLRQLWAQLLERKADLQFMRPAPAEQPYVVNLSPLP